MLKVLLPVDGSKSAANATRKLVETLKWYKEPPQIDLLAVHLPVPRLQNMDVVINDEMIERYYAEGCEQMLAPSKKMLDEASVAYTAHTLVGSIAESIVEQAKQSGSNMISTWARVV